MNNNNNNNNNNWKSHHLVGKIKYVSDFKAQYRVYKQAMDFKSADFKSI